MVLSRNEITILNSLAEMVVIIDEQGIIRFFNRAAEKAFGYTASELDGLNVSTLMPRHDRARHDGYMERYLTTGSPRFLGVEGRELLAMRKDGSEFDIEMMVNEVTIQNRRHFIGSMRDITARKLDSEKSRLLEIRLRNAQRISRLGNWEWNVRTGELWWSDEVYRIFGYEKETFGATYEAFLGAVYPHDRPDLEKAVQNALENRARYRIRHRVLRPDGKVRIVDERGEVQFAANGEAIAMSGTVQDITDQANTELQLQKAMRLDSVDRLSGGIAHDFNNLLGVIIGNMENLEHLLGDADGAAEVANTLAAAQKGADLVRRLMAFSRQQVLNPEVTDLGRQVDGLRDLIVRTVPASIEVVFDISASPCFSAIDTSQFESAILNLSINARDAMAEGGRLAFTVSREHVPTESIMGGALVLPGDYACVEVADTGSGISENILHRIFEPFFTTKEDGRGSGLGLSMIYGFVEQSGGFFCIDTEEGVGTTIKLMFPEVDGGQQTTAADTEQACSQTDGTREMAKILVVEDEEMLRSLLDKQLTMKGFQVLVAVDAAQALEALALHQDIDLVLTDMTLPGGMSGQQLGELMERQYPAVRKISMSGYFHQTEGEKSLDTLFDSFLTKPFKIADLVAEVTKVL